MDEEAVGAYDEALVRDGHCWEAYLGRGEALLEVCCSLTKGEVPVILGARAVGDFERVFHWLVARMGRSFGFVCDRASCYLAIMRGVKIS